ncbi:putative bifunctional udp-n-acetylglucosamine transferase and deubiquitinase alg13 [Monocercomonoides exilis]|uniref:putative bifunctional udp-n-acetylglucosamine transferase and deubiquitinase alg13 n=1 Tax=Monocercomonoides exilis TaxID=2049356 RepID=UPI00355A8B38|nr:putative bifunctional udp-n-acetylglucosamine transferase and deubiquitinase alg13 [Monocercomonoides exilis]|eukprot:MONOS_8292.1-p1 / transcript=MONOS_8292.1 / gene=MONOS_8292 / organism=Monocercomonoides_exilis_PA203 / gene_product=uncharacterized protein LOC436733 / transcript_product=uncharacterized protein LOC436733 / location=Mono_scaffold00309:18984-19647(-) / protein_length=176 / sequence_SO=supercontig / SO=protein_coding / is_pseudo=false
MSGSGPTKKEFPTIFITVGTTKFEQLIETIDTDAFFHTLIFLKCSRLIIQKGNSEYQPTHLLARRSPGFSVEVYQFKSSLLEDIQSSDLVISHSGAGTIIEVLGFHKPLVVVINETLLHNHQSELATALKKDGHLISATCSSLIDELRLLPSTTFHELPPSNPHAFEKYLDQIIGD